MMSLDEAILHAEEVADRCEDFVVNHKNLGELGFTKRTEKCAAEHRQLAAWLRELQEHRKAPEIVHCGECVNFSERDFCKVAGHNVHRKSDCMKVFGAERRTDEMQ